jgi:hypothetical protein
MPKLLAIREVDEKFPHLTSFVHGNISQNSGGSRLDAVKALYNKTKHHELYKTADRALAKAYNSDHKRIKDAGMSTEDEPHKDIPMHALKALDTLY